MARPRPKRPPKPPADDEPPYLDAIALLPWATGIALGVARDYNFLRDSSEEEELRSTAAEALIELMHRFDQTKIPAGKSVVGGFKGFATVEIRSRCRRHAVRLRNGGTFYTSHSPEAWKINVRGLPARRSAGDEPEECPLPWPEREDVPELETQRGRELFQLLLTLERKGKGAKLADVARIVLLVLFGETPAFHRPAPAGCNPRTPGLSRFRSKTDRNRPVRESVAGKNCA